MGTILYDENGYGNGTWDRGGWDGDGDGNGDGGGGGCGWDGSGRDMISACFK